MRMTTQQHRENAQDWIAASSPSYHGEDVDRAQLAGQLVYTIADNEDVNAIAQEIEAISSEADNVKS